MSHLRALLCLAAACLALGAGLAASAGAATPTAAATAGAQTVTTELDPWQLPDRLIEHIDANWQTGRQVYLDRDRISIRANAMLLELHALAALAGHTGAARQDARLPGLVRFFTTEPVVVYRNTKKRQVAHFPHTPAWSSVFTRNSAQATLHPSADAIIARALATAWRAREVSGLPLEDSQRIQTVIGQVANGAWYRAPNRAENQINWNAAVYAANLEVNGDRRNLPDYRAHLKWFIDHAARKAYRDGSSNLSRGQGFRYLPQREATSSGANAIDTVEYANLVHSALGFYTTAVRAGMRPLNGRQISNLRSWSRNVLFGSWTHSGYLNWDTGLGSSRRHLRQYWAFALDGLVVSAGPGSLTGTAHQRSFVRELAEQGLALFAREGWNGTGPLPGATSFDAPNGFVSGTRSPLITPLRFAVIAASLDTRLPATVPRTMGNIYSHDSDFGRLAISTPAYNTAIIKPAGQHQGGIEPVRLFDSRQRPLTVLTAGSFKGAAPGIRLARDGATVLDDQPGVQNRAGRVPSMRVPGQQHNNAGRFKVLRATATMRKGKASIAVSHRFDGTAIETGYRISRGAANTITLRMPVWGRASKIAFTRGVKRRGNRLVRHGDGTLLMRGTTPDGAVMFVAFRGVPRDARVAIVGHGRTASAPQGARELRIRFKATKRAAIRRRISIVAQAPLN